MALVLRNLYDYYNFFFNEFKDPRTTNFPLVGSPLPVILIIIIYLKFVKNWGPRFMENRQPYELKTCMNVFNIIQVLTNLFIAVYGTYYSYWQADFSLRCQPLEHVDTPHMRKLVFATYLYFLTKILDLLDTVFFVLRKKYNQISFLHLYHHAGMVAATYAFIKFLAGSHATLLGNINSFVHVIMYSYYFLTSFKPELKKSLWWKKYITQVQLVQFLILTVHFGLPIFMKNCQYPRTILFIGMSQNIFMLSLFADFYIKAYHKKKN